MGEAPPALQYKSCNRAAGHRTVTGRRLGIPVGKAKQLVLHYGAGQHLPNGAGDIQLAGYEFPVEHRRCYQFGQN